VKYGGVLLRRQAINPDDTSQRRSGLFTTVTPLLSPLSSIHHLNRREFLTKRFLGAGRPPLARNENYSDHD